MAAPHAIQRRLWAEELVRLRRARERERYAASQRRGRIDPNPHQIDAVIFALERIDEGGCILADEVGLGKTIEAGLVMAQLSAEGKARRILVIVPKPLLGQWQHELYALFGLETHEGGADPRSFEGEGVFLIGREFAGSERGAALLEQAAPFGLCVIDEAHEIFAGIHRRYDREGHYQQDSKDAMIAHRVKQALGMTPKLLLTATPIQNSLTELWGLVQYVEPTGTLLGDLATFRALFCQGDDRTLAAGQAHELRRRIGQICQRTLRRQAQEFLERPFVGRNAMLSEYSMSDAERDLYDDVTRYLLEPNLCAFRGRQRQLLLIGFHRRMASSLPALTSSLTKVTERLQRMLDGADVAKEVVRVFAQDLEDEELGEESSVDEAPPDPNAVAAELERVKGFVARTERIDVDTKAEKLLEAISMIQAREDQGKGSGKVVIFTESLTTQSYLRNVLIHNGIADRDVTLFRGTNDSPRAAEALEIWQAEVEHQLPAYNRPSRDIAVRLALVHEFRTRSKIFISTEAGAKGLNLQFCDTLVNYDLPWNPQRIEQRIGRCHRYGQTRDVTVINFSARDNEAQRLTLEILTTKLDLFGKVLDASDVVLHEPSSDSPELLAGALGADFQARLHRIYERARNIEEIEGELRQLREDIGEQREAFENALERTDGIIESRFDESVRQSFRRIQDNLPISLAQLDQNVDRLLSGYLDAIGVSYERRKAEGRVYYEISASAQLPPGLSAGLEVAVGHAKGLEDTDPVHLGHPLLQAAVEEARAASAAVHQVRFTLDQTAPGGLAARRGQRGKLVVLKFGYSGFEPVEHLQPIVVMEGEEAALAREDADALLRLVPDDLAGIHPPLTVEAALIDDSIDEYLFLDQASVAEVEQERFERSIAQIERYVEDRVLVLRRQQEALRGKFTKAQKKRDAAMGADAREAGDRELQRLERELDGVEGEIDMLQERRDESYQHWRDHAHDRRYAVPEVVRVIDLEFVLE